MTVNQNLVPIVIEKSGRTERAYDIYSRLLKDRIIFLGGQIDDAAANLIIAQMLFLSNESTKNDIHFYINSPGGAITATGVLEGTATDLEIEAKEILRLRSRLYKVLAKHTGQSQEKIEKDCDRDLWLEAEEAISYGLADRILQKAPELVNSKKED